jgi:hypothetical protein
MVELLKIGKPKTSSGRQRQNSGFAETMHMTKMSFITLAFSLVSACKLRARVRCSVRPSSTMSSTDPEYARQQETRQGAGDIMSDSTSRREVREPVTYLQHREKSLSISGERKARDASEGHREVWSHA